MPTASPSLMAMASATMPRMMISKAGMGLSRGRAQGLAPDPGRDLHESAVACLQVAAPVGVGLAGVWPFDDSVQGVLGMSEVGAVRGLHPGALVRAGGRFLELVTGCLLGDLGDLGGHDRGEALALVGEVGDLAALFGGLDRLPQPGALFLKALLALPGVDDLGVVAHGVP